MRVIKAICCHCGAGEDADLKLFGDGWICKKCRKAKGLEDHNERDISAEFQDKI